MPLQLNAASAVDGSSVRQHFQCKHLSAAAILRTSKALLALHADEVLQCALAAYKLTSLVSIQTPSQSLAAVSSEKPISAS